MPTPTEQIEKRVRRPVTLRDAPAFTDATAVAALHAANKRQSYLVLALRAQTDEMLRLAHFVRRELRLCAQGKTEIGAVRAAKLGEALAKIERVK